MANRRRRGEINLDAILESLRENNAHPDRYGIDFGPQMPNYIETYQRLQPRVRRSRYHDRACMNGMGIEGDIFYMLRRCQVRWFFNMTHTTYIPLVLEFLTSLRVERAPGSNYPVAFTFRLGNRERRMTTPALNGMFGCPRGEGGSLFMKKETYNQITFWRELTDAPHLVPDPYSPSTSRPSAIRNPSMRYMERILAHSVFARAEAASVIQDELYVLWCLRHGVFFDLGAYFILQCEKITTHTTARVMIGGFLTEFARHYDLDVEGMERPEECPNLNFQAMVSMRMLEMIGGTWCLRQLGGYHFPLPNTDLTTITGPPQNMTLTGQEHTTTYNRFVSMNRGAAIRAGMAVPQVEIPDPAETAEEEQAEEAEEAERAEGVGEAGPAPVEQRGHQFIWHLQQNDWNRLNIQVENLGDRMTEMEGQVGEMLQILRQMNEYHIGSNHYAASPPPPPGH
ncbi:hypothetical protein ACS0TY_036983 [Phlomoides rotata]